ncbi:hypothetical protein MPLSOD_410037 [Mesorhizobium sp. SOD10]|nr:hypothetical protein MPLSOD_410037 [Mesorhizobium sp. SOD10]
MKSAWSTAVFSQAHNSQSYPHESNPYSTDLVPVIYFLQENQDATLGNAKCLNAVAAAIPAA